MRRPVRLGLRALRGAVPVNDPDFQVDVATTLTAFGVALCNQPGINGELFIRDVLDTLELLCGSPQAVPEVGRLAVSAIAAALQVKRDSDRRQP